MISVPQPRAHGFVHQLSARRYGRPAAPGAAGATTPGGSPYGEPGSEAAGEHDREPIPEAAPDPCDGGRCPGAADGHDRGRARRPPPRPRASSAPPPHTKANPAHWRHTHVATGPAPQTARVRDRRNRWASVAGNPVMSGPRARMATNRPRRV
ncbi:hypothetical protein [Nonomuraea sp. B19D2]|uniref:hypothetical protein n=1 Tax=Nonomuraea sp. B19D2 TaxID=3159561 RepID=UPI0032DABDBD